MVKKKQFVYLSIILAALFAVAAYYLVWPIVSPTMTWQRFSEMVDAALKKEDNPVITLGKRVLAMRKEDMNRPVRCGPGQSVTIVGTGREGGDFERMLIESGDIRLRNVRVGALGDGTIYAKVLGPASLNLALDERCVVDADLIAIAVDMSRIADGSRVRVDNAGKLKARDMAGILVKIENPHSYEAEIVNSGIIEGGGEGILLMDTGRGGSSRVHIVNTGTIASDMSTAVFAQAWAQDGDVTIDIKNDGRIRSEQHRGISVSALSESGRATVAVHNAEHGDIESSWQSIHVSAANDGRILVGNAGLLRSQQKPVFASFDWKVPATEMPQGWDADESAMRDEAKRFAIAKMRETGTAVLPAGAQIKARVGITGKGKGESESELYHAFFTFLAGMNMDVSVGEN